MKFTQYINSAYSRMIMTLKKNEVEISNHFNPLTPTDNAEDCNIYLESIEWALKNRRTIKNVAISGTYGSGKSSIIKTFIKRISKSENYFRHLFYPEYRFLNISLATFKENIVGGQNLKDEDLLRLIELSILQQLFFHEKNHKTPDSRFKKINKEGWFKLFLYTLLTLISLLSILYLFFPTIFYTISLFSFIDKGSKFAGQLSSIVIIFSFFLLILKSSRTLISASIKKLNINNAEIEIDNGISKSILNNHLDEIIYFFEATEYNVIIIEDLDRFEQTEVFTKLREINLLINNSNKIKRDIVFIYAIKDDMFLDKDRAKFFDFMIPIIPVIDFSNSGNKLRKIIKQNNYKISESLIDDLSMFIDDMRLLYNIMNEYYIYSKKLGSNFQNQILAMIVYKNIFPNDFTLLSQNRGDLYKAIDKKQVFIKTKISELDIQINLLKEKIQISEDQKLNDVFELRALYILAIIDKINATGFMGFSINGELVKNYDLCEDINFNSILNGSINYFHKEYNRRETNTYNFKFADIELIIDKNRNYKQREEQIKNRSKINDLKKEIEKLKDQQNLTRKFNLKELVSNKQILVEDNINENNVETKKKNDLINILLRHGYIDENYSDYVSIFHEGALTKSDYQFLINVKKEDKTDLTYKLIKTAELIKKIDDFAFEKEYIFNHNLIDFLLKSQVYKNKKDHFFKQISNEESSCINFIDEHINNSSNIEIFINEICHYWQNIWNFVSHTAQYTDERIDRYFKLIIQYANIDDIKKIFEGDIVYLNQYKNFLNIPTKKDKLEQVIARLNLKFISIEIDSPEIYLDYIFKNNYYDININIFRILMSFNKDFEWEEFEKANYGYIQSKQYQHQIDYIESNIDEYIEFIYLKLENNIEEQIEDYVKLLNNTELDVSLKEKVIIKVKNIVENISEIKNLETINLLFKFSKVSPTWDNILYAFEIEENHFNEDIITYLNFLPNAEVLSREKMTTEKVGDYLKYNAICYEIIHELKINIDSFKLLIKSDPWWYDTFQVEKLSKEKVTILIENRVVSPTMKSYKFLKDNFSGTNILLIERYFEKFKDKINVIEFDNYDLNIILKSTIFSAYYKFNIINNFDEGVVSENSENSKRIAQLIIDNESYFVSDSFKISLINNENISQKNRLILFDRYSRLIKKEMLYDFLISMDEVYGKITNMRKKAILDDNTLNRKLLSNLIRLDYISSYSIIEKGLRVNHKRKE